MRNVKQLPMAPNLIIIALICQGIVFEAENNVLPQVRHEGLRNTNQKGGGPVNNK